MAHYPGELSGYPCNISPKSVTGCVYTICKIMNIQPTTTKCLNRIWSFLNDQIILNIATSVNDEPYCASCFYVFDEQHKLLLFKSKKDTRHIKEALQQNNVAGTVLPIYQKLETIMGIQFQGTLIFPATKILSSIKAKYYSKYPYARVVTGDFWIIELNYIKMTDNQLGFGKKLLWHKSV